MDRELKPHGVPDDNHLSAANAVGDGAQRARGALVLRHSCNVGSAQC